MEPANIRPGTLLAFTVNEDVYHTERQFDELGRIRTVTSRLIGKREVSTIYTAVRVRQLKRSVSVRAMDLDGNLVRLSITPENSSRWSMCEPVPSL
jgi:hypothetical protein